LITINLLTLDIDESTIEISPEQGRSLQFALNHFYSSEEVDAPIYYPGYAWNVDGGNASISISK
jgi:hypothetical protein